MNRSRSILDRLHNTGHNQGSNQKQTENRSQNTTQLVVTLVFNTHKKELFNVYRYAPNLSGLVFADFIFPSFTALVCSYCITQSLWASSLVSSVQWPSSPSFQIFTRLSQPPETNLEQKGRAQQQPTELVNGRRNAPFYFMEYRVSNLNLKEPIRTHQRNSKKQFFTAYIFSLFFNEHILKHFFFYLFPEELEGHQPTLLQPMVWALLIFSASHWLLLLYVSTLMAPSLEPQASTSPKSWGAQATLTTQEEKRIREISK